MSYNIEARVHVLQSGGEQVTSGFGPRTIFINGAYNSHSHSGIDLISRALAGDYIVAFARGLVTEARDTVAGYSETLASGNYVRLQHGGNLVTEYFHMKQGSVTVRPGQIVERGQVLGFMGATGWVTGAHLHFGVRLGGAAQDPEPYLLGERTVPAYTGATVAAGGAVQLSGVPLYASSTAAAPSGQLNGLYYLWGPEIVSGRCRVTNRADRVGVVGQVTGWVAAGEILAAEDKTPPADAKPESADTTELDALRAAVAAVKKAVAGL